MVYGVQQYLPIIYGLFDVLVAYDLQACFFKSLMINDASIFLQIQLEKKSNLFSKLSSSQYNKTFILCFPFFLKLEHGTRQFGNANSFITWNALGSFSVINFLL